MHIEFERTGGFAGIRLATGFDIDDLPDDQAGALRQLIEQADFFSLSENLLGTPMPDVFQYTLTIGSAEHRHTVRTDDVSATPPLQRLLNELSLLVRSQRK